MAEEVEDPQFWLPSHFLDDEDDHPPPIPANDDDHPPPITAADDDDEEEEDGDEEEEEDPRPRRHHEGHQKASMSLSPPSTLYGMGSWSTSSRESFSSSPPSSLRKDDPWDLTKLPDDESQPEPEPIPLRCKPEEKRKQRSAWGGGRSAGGAAALPLGLSASAWPPLLPRPKPGPNAGMRAVFLQRGGSKEPSGTGVFHPRSTNVASEPACTTVLLPAKVVHALNGHGRSGLEPDPIFIHNVTLLQKRGLLPELSPSQPSTQESVMPDQKIRLPSEWTY